MIDLVSELHRAGNDYYLRTPGMFLKITRRLVWKTDDADNLDITT